MLLWWLMASNNVFQLQSSRSHVRFEIGQVGHGAPAKRSGYMDKSSVCCRTAKLRPKTLFCTAIAVGILRCPEFAIAEPTGLFIGRKKFSFA
jgi:hypothetical protein